MEEIIINPNSKGYQLVGVIPECIIKHYGLQCNSYEVHMAPGLLKHLKKRGHWDDFMLYYQDIPDMISNPDYAGQNPKETNSVELYKIVDEYVLIAIKLNPETGLFLGSFYELDNGYDKIKKRLRSNRIYEFSFFIESVDKENKI